MYRAAADRRAESIEARLIGWGTENKTSGDVVYNSYWRADGEDGHRPFFHPVDAGLPVVSLLGYVEIADEAAKEKALDAGRKALGFEIAVTAEVANPFGYTRQLVQSRGGAATRRTSFFFPHDTETAPWWQGENARLGSLAAAARMAARSLSNGAGAKVTEAILRPAAAAAFITKLRAFGSDQLNWILGLNPYDACMLHGHGRNNIAYMFFDSYEYTNAPGGICNGITGGYAEGDVDGIDFGLRYAETGKDDDWRWSEQWLPHAAGDLLAIAIGD